MRPLGSGGFADVFLYEQELPRREVAVKVLPAVDAAVDVRRMFNAEADVLARLSSHPSILTIYSAGLAADGRPYLVMEYCPSSMGERYRSEQLSVAEVLTVGVKMSSALETAHRAGLMHRDLKPSNILVTEFGVPVLADFGIAASLSAARDQELAAMSIPWSAPEVVSGQTRGTVASEVWSLGATIYSLFAGRTPFERTAGHNTAEQLRDRIARAVYIPTGRIDLNTDVEHLLSRALSRDPAQRPGSARELGVGFQDAQRALGLGVTDLELAAHGWAGPDAIDFSDAGDRGAVRVKVPTTTKRKSAAPVPLASRSAVSGSTSVVDLPGRRRTARPWLLAGLGLTALVAAFAVLLHLVGVF